MMIKKLHFGTAGIPLSTEDRNTPNGIKRVNELGLSAFELEFVRSVNISREKAPVIKKVAEENALALADRNDEVNALIECARYQNVWIQVHAEDLKDERRDHFIDNLLHRGLIALGLIAVAL